MKLNFNNWRVIWKGNPETDKPDCSCGQKTQIFQYDGFDSRKGIAEACPFCGEVVAIDECGKKLAIEEGCL